MLPILDVIFAAAVVISSINLYPTEDISVTPALDVATEFSAHREWWREDGKGKCSYTGLMIPYARDWDEVDEFGSVTRAAEPNIPVAQAILVNKKVCEGKPDEVLFRAGEVWRTEGLIRAGLIINVGDMTEAREDQRPKWYGQVMARLERLAKTDPKVQAFSDSLETLKTAKAALDEAAQAAPAAPANQE